LYVLKVLFSDVQGWDSGRQFSTHSCRLVDAYINNHLTVAYDPLNFLI
jgi:hypothetical protein